MNDVYHLNLLLEHGKDILTSSKMQSEKNFIQHGELSCYHHSLFVAYISLLIAQKMHLKVDVRSLIRGALLHDFFLYDWHLPSPHNKRHAFSHPYRAYLNASLEFEMSEREKDIIIKHMFPLTLKFPKYRESYIVLLADKYCAVYETLAWNRTKVKLDIMNSYIENKIIISK
ncbi:MAG: HD domain-containing protein [Longibaculum sp.]